MVNTTECRSCSAKTREIFRGVLIGNTVKYFECAACGYVQTEAPYWLDRAYAEAINISDTGIMLRNQRNTQVVVATLLCLGKLQGTLVDCAGGYGILVRMLRDIGVSALWSDPYCTNLVARGFERTDQSADLVTAFEVFEHFVKPADELDKLLSISPSVLISTELIAQPTPSPDDWWYYGREHGQHIGFYRLSTLRKFAKDRGKHLVSDGGSYHLITDKVVNAVWWRALLKWSWLASAIARSKLQSRVWTDHELLSGPRK